MRVFLFSLILILPAFAYGQDLDIGVRPSVVYIETLEGNIVPMERVFFHVVFDNQSKAPMEIQWVRFDMVNSKGVLFSGQYSGSALMDLFDSAMERKRIEATPEQTLTIGAAQRKAISDVFMDFPKGFVGENLLVEVDYKSDGKETSRKNSIQLQRNAGFSGRLPFDGTWYVAAEHSYLDAHKRFLAEAYAYDFLQIGTSGRSFQRDGKNNADYYAYGKKVLAAKDGTVVMVKNDIAENVPGQTNLNTPSGNVVVIDHGNNQFGYYAHLKPFAVAVKKGAHVKAGDVLGEVGNSGDSPEPHLHFHVMNNADAAQGDGIPLVFEHWKAQSYGRFPAARQFGVLPRGEFVQP
jgi:murein DD-endopeptidase MepM/ murein hydrolase activator NlpD